MCDDAQPEFIPYLSTNIKIFWLFGFEVESAQARGWVVAYCAKTWWNETVITKRDKSPFRHKHELPKQETNSHVRYRRTQRHLPYGFVA
jgi:hypothetical protein